MKSFFVDAGIQLRVCEWPGEKRPFILLHGLASNALTWQKTAVLLNQAGHRVLAVDQRGHGLSDKPKSGYDFDTITADLAALLRVLKIEKPHIAGQSWGGNVVLAFAAKYPGTAAAYTFVDGGIINLQARNNTWEQIAADLRPPDLQGMPRQQLKAIIAQNHPDWDEDGVEATLGNFETMADGTIRPWLTLDKHMAILRAMWEQNPANLYPLVQEPVQIVLADGGSDAWTAEKRRQVQLAVQHLPKATVHWLPNTDHDIHIHRPAELARLMLEMES